MSHTQIHKHKYTNTQIQHMTKCQKDPTCGIFLKRGLFKDIKIIFPCVERTITQIQIHKYTNTAYDEVPERPNMQYILKKKDCSRVSKIIFPCVKCANAKLSARKTQHVVYFEKAIVQGCLLSLAQLYRVYFPRSFG